MSAFPLPSTYTFKLTLPSLTDTSHTTRLLLLPCSPLPSWSSLAATIQLRFALPSPPSALTYLDDDDDDEITLSSDAELAEFLLDAQDDQEIKLTVLRAVEQEQEPSAESLLDSLHSALKQDRSLAGPLHRALSKYTHTQRHHPYASDFGRRRGGGRGRARRREQSVEVEELVLSDSESDDDSVTSDESGTEVQMSEQSESGSESESEVDLDEQEQPPRHRRGRFPFPKADHHHHRAQLPHGNKHFHPSHRSFKHRGPSRTPFNDFPPPRARHSGFPSPPSHFDFNIPRHDAFDFQLPFEPEHGFHRFGRGRGGCGDRAGLGGRGRDGRRGRGGFGGRGERMMF